MRIETLIVLIVLGLVSILTSILYIVVLVFVKKTILSSTKESFKEKRNSITTGRLGLFWLKLLFVVRSIFISYPVKLLESFASRQHKAVILDVGCGVGVSIKEIRSYNKCAFIVGLDIGKSPIRKYAKPLFCEEENVEFVIGDAQNLPFRSNFFDILLLKEVIEHVSNDERVCSEASRVSKVGGILLVTTPCSYFKQSYEYPITVFLARLIPQRFHKYFGSTVRYGKKGYVEYMKEVGHVRSGYSMGQLKEILLAFNFRTIWAIYLGKRGAGALLMELTLAWPSAVGMALTPLKEIMLPIIDRYDCLVNGEGNTLIMLAKKKNLTC